MRVIEHRRQSTPSITQEDATTIVYALTVDERMGEPDGVRTETYGVMVTVEDGDSVCVRDITVSAARIFELIELLYRGAVTPATLYDVIYDWLER